MYQYFSLWWVLRSSIHECMYLHWWRGSYWTEFGVNFFYCGNVKYIYDCFTCTVDFSKERHYSKFGTRWKLFVQTLILRSCPLIIHHLIILCEMVFANDSFYRKVTPVLQSSLFFIPHRSKGERVYCFTLVCLSIRVSVRNKFSSQRGYYLWALAHRLLVWKWFYVILHCV